MLVDHFLARSARQSPDKTALIAGDRRLTYAELDRQATRLAGGLMRLGVRPGDRVAIYLENSVEAVVGIFAALRVGGVFIVLNPTMKAEKLAFVLNNSRAAALIVDRSRAVIVREVEDQLSHVLAVVNASGGPLNLSRVPECSLASLISDGGSPEVALPRRIDQDLAALIYTSGSTGTPKGVMLTHLNMVAAATSITQYLGNTASDVILNVLPLSFDYGLYQVLMAFKVGGTVILERSFAYPHSVLEKIAAERVTGFPIVPTIAALLLKLDLTSYDFSSLTYVTNTAAALPTHHIAELRRLLPHVRLYSMYGLTECKRVAYLPPECLDARPDSVGMAMPNVEVYVVDEAGRRCETGTGELLIRGANVMKGYWEMPEETERVLKPGPLPGERVLHSGDIFRIDADGYLYFVGRKDEIIKTRGEKVSPREVENVLTSLDGIAEAAVIGVPDEILGQAIKGIVTLRPGATLTEQQVLRHCAKHLEDFMMPRQVEIVACLPTTATGKVAKRMLAV